MQVLIVEDSATGKKRVVFENEGNTCEVRSSTTGSDGQVVFDFDEVPEAGNARFMSQDFAGVISRSKGLSGRVVKKSSPLQLPPAQLDGAILESSHIVNSTSKPEAEFLELSNGAIHASDAFPKLN